VKISYFIILACLVKFSWAQESRPYSIEELVSYIEEDLEHALPWESNQIYEPSIIERFTPLPITRAFQLFHSLKSDGRARQRYPNGWCSQRRAHIQRVLRSKDIYSGRLYINCPANKGRLRLLDQVSGRYYTFINFHDTNVVVVKTRFGNFYLVMDPQYQDRPVGLGRYLAEIEQYQRLEPSSEPTRYAGICYWSVSSPSSFLELEDEELAKQIELQ